MCLDQWPQVRALPVSTGLQGDRSAVQVYRPRHGDHATAMKSSRQEFNRTGQRLAAAFDEFGVPKKEMKELLAAIGSMLGDIEGK